MVGRTTSKDPTEPNKVASFEESLEDELSQDATSAAVTVEPKQPFVAGLELTAKLATAVLGVLYVLGLLISNIQLMALGISDFSSIQARNVITGFGFTSYLSFLCIVILSPVGIALFTHNVREKVIRRNIINQNRIRANRNITKIEVIMFFSLAIFMIFAAAVFAGGFAGSIIVYGRPLGLSTSNTSFWYDIYTFLKQFIDLYFNYAIFLACIFVLPPLIILLLIPISPFLEKTVSELYPSIRMFKATLLINFLIVLPFLLLHYADDIYPNVRYNLGGGQPQVTQLILTGKKLDLAGSSDLAASPATVLCCGDEKTEQAVKTDDVAVWYQSDKFIYVSSLKQCKSSDPAITAIDIKLVRDIMYLPKYVKVRAGGIIDRVYPCPENAHH